MGINLIRNMQEFHIENYNFIEEHNRICINGEK